MRNHNIPSAWDWLKTYKKVRKEAFHVCDIKCRHHTNLYWEEFLFIWMCKNAQDLFPAAAMADSIFAEKRKSNRKQLKTPNKQTILRGKTIENNKTK